MRRDSIIPVKTPPDTKGHAKPYIPTREKGFEMPKYKGLAVADRQNHGKRARVQNWLIQEGWQIGELQSPQASWIIQATDQQGRVVLVAQPLAVSDKLDIHAQLTLDSQTAANLEHLESKERHVFLCEVRSDIIRLGVDYAEAGKQPDLPTQLVLQQQIYDDGLTKDNFSQRVHQVIKAVCLVQLAFGRKFTDPNPPLNKVGFVN